MKMESLTKTVTILSFILATFGIVVALLDIDELKSVNYGVDILSEPVVLKPEVCILLK